MVNQLMPNNPLIQEVRKLVKTARIVWHNRLNTQLLMTYWQMAGRLWNMNSKAKSAQNMASRYRKSWPKN